MNAPSSMPSGWFPDPHGRHEHRWFNGEAWTADVADDGQRRVDPMGAAPARHSMPADGPGNRSATAALTLGMIGLFLAWIPFIVGIGVVLAILAIVFGVRGRRQAATVGSGRGMAIGGIVTGGAGLGLSVLGFVLTASTFSAFEEFLDPAPFEAEVQDCRIDGLTIRISATLQNLDDEVRDFTVYGVVREPIGVDDIVLAVDDMRPGETRAIELVDVIERAGDCTARLVVHGPLPYGMNMERVRD